MHAMVSTLKHYQFGAYVPDSSPFMDDRETMPFFIRNNFLHHLGVSQKCHMYC